MSKLKRTNKVAGKGILHEDWIFEVLGKGDEPSTYYNLLEILGEFKGKHITFSAAEDKMVEEAVNDIADEDEDL